jgi:hypothetical protein
MSVHVAESVHEHVANQALLVAEAADVLLDMAAKAGSRHQDLADLEDIHAEADLLATGSGLEDAVAHMLTDILDLGRMLAAHTDPLPDSLVAECHVVRKMARTLSEALESGVEQPYVQQLNRCAAALDGRAPLGTDLPTAAKSAGQALHGMLREWSLGL